MKKTTKATVILNGFCAAVFTFSAVMDIIRQEYRESALMFALSALCAILWIIVFVMSIRKYRNDQKG